MTINPKEDLFYAREINRDTGLPNLPYKYSYSIAKTATDANANSLDQGYDCSFSSLRIRRKFVLYSSIDADVRSDGLVGGCSTNNQKNIAMCVGESGIKGHPFYRSFIGFDLSQLPAGIEIYSAGLYISQFQTDGAPYHKLGRIIVDHVNFGKEIDKNDYNTDTLDYLGRIGGTSTPIIYYLPVTKAIIKDLENNISNSYRSQYRLKMNKETSTGSGNVVYFYTSEYSKQGKRPYIAIKDLIP